MAGTAPHPTARGQVAPLVLVALLLAGLVTLGIARLGGAVARREAAQAAADASALAGAARGEEAARAVARANRAEVIAYRTEGRDVIVTVERAGVQRSARARWVPDDPGGGEPPTGWPGAEGAGSAGVPSSSPETRALDPVHLPGA